MSGCLTRFGGLAVGHEEEQKRYFRERRLYTLQLESTDACAQSCVYCYAGSSPSQTRALAAEEIRNLLDAAAHLEIRAIDWLGGDPLARPDWLVLMRYARSLGLTNNVWTSGIPLGERDTARSVAEVTEGGFVSVHLDSTSSATYTRLHPEGDARNIDLIIEGVDNLLAAGKPPEQMINCIAFTALQPVSDVVETMRWFKHEKGLRTCLTLFNPAGKGAGWRSLVPAPDDIRAVYSERDRVNYGARAGTIAAMDADKFYCGTMATVTFNGDVTPCSVIREGVGNVRVTPFARIVHEHLGDLVHDSLHDPRQMPAPCNRCRQNSHCWGCRASAYHYGGSANGPDPKCWVLTAARPDQHSVETDSTQRKDCHEFTEAAGRWTERSE